ncbi:hypothetical protein MMC19_003297 [Ptychographa xylographoides]|nr:hypothetical protein [Ptychographa xylographoides]
MPYSPTTPHRRRPSSGFDLSFASESPQSPTYAAIRPSHSRKSSVQSILSLRTPTSPRPPSSHDRNGGFNFSNDFGGSGDARNGLGSLADELAEGWDEDGEVEDGSSMMLSEDRGYDGQVPTPASPQFDHSTIGLALSPLHEQPNGSLSPPKKSFRSRRLGKPSDYDGSDYGEGSDFEGTRISPSLDTRMAVIESLARQGAASTEVEANGVFFRVADSLRELGSQASVESHATRYVWPPWAPIRLKYWH